MLQPTDNTSFLAVYEQVFDHEICSKLLDIERNIQRDPHIINYQRKAECLMMAFMFLNLHKQRIEHQQARAPKPANRPELRLDSRIIAEQLGVEHPSVLRTITRYHSDLESFGSLGFEIQVRDRQGIPTRFALLNENQCYFLATLSRNTRQVVAFKMWLVRTFDEYRSGKAPEQGKLSQ